ncbi:hypothetical protein P3L10_015191 [Capsicum annuum]
MSTSNQSLAATAAILSHFLLSCIQCHAQLSATFYDDTCPDALNTIRATIRQAISEELRMAASLIRLHFHDCFVLVSCDASILLDDAPSIESEKTAVPNLGSARGFGIIEDVKREVEESCPGVVSCADILAVTARDASVAVGGPSWIVKLGRRDSTSANKTLANTDISGPFDSLNKLISRFANKGFSTRDMVALSGFTAMEQTSMLILQALDCPPEGENENLAHIDLVTPNELDNNYFKNLVDKKSLLQSDQVLFNGGSTDSIVSEYSNSPRAFSSDFAAAMIKMGDINPLAGLWKCELVLPVCIFGT